MASSGPGEVWDQPGAGDFDAMRSSAGLGYRAVYYNKWGGIVDPFTDETPQPPRPLPPDWRRVFREKTQIPMKP